MKAVARHWLNYNGVWYKAGEEFEVKNIAEVKDYADPLIDVPQVSLKEEPNATPRRGRQKKTED